MMKKILFGGVFMVLSVATFGQSQNYQTHTLFMYGFIKYVQWPAEDAQGDFEIAVLGDSPILAELKLMAEKKKVGTRAIHVTKVSSVEEVKKSHILYVSPSFNPRFAEVASKVGDQSILMITEQAPATNKGCINFVNKDGKLAFEMNQASLTKQHLKASNELIRMAITN
jgi:hypothetical protein